LNCRQKEIVKRAIEDESKKLEQIIYALAVCSNHVHIVVNFTKEKIETAAGKYKRAATQALKANGFDGKFWTKGFDKRFCFDEKALKARIGYVERHGE